MALGDILQCENQSTIAIIMSNQPLSMKLQHAHMLSTNVKHFVFICQQDSPFDYLPGQFINISFNHEGKIVRRSYSIANIPEKTNTIEFAASFVPGGIASEILFNLKPGDELQFTGPHGRLVLKDEPPPGRYILVATSTGVTPYRAMLTQLMQQLEQHPNLQVVIIQGGQTRDNILYRDDFATFAANHPRAQFRAQLSREEAPDANQHEYSGYVQTAFPHLNLDPTQDVVYLCGNPAMIDESFDYLKEHGFPVQQVVREKYISR